MFIHRKSILVTVTIIYTYFKKIIDKTSDPAYAGTYYLNLVEAIIRDYYAENCEHFSWHGMRSYI